jgi:hypothetical protein
MKRHKWWWSWAVMAATLACTLQEPMRATARDAQLHSDSQAPQDGQNAADLDPPGRVAKLNYLEGSVSFQPGGENDWVSAALNRPLATGDNLWADEDSRAEVQAGGSGKWRKRESASKAGTESAPGAVVSRDPATIEMT